MQQEMFHILSEVTPTVLYVTHDLEEALTLGHRVALMTARPGRIRELREIDFGQRDDVMAIRSRPEFGRMAEEMWHLLASEVGQTLG
jgi:NitT/TauT family transport system ATP-binding protein